MCVLLAGATELYHFAGRVGRIKKRFATAPPAIRAIEEKIYDFGHRCKWKRREGCFAGSSEEQGKTSRDVPFDRGSDKSPSGNGDSDCGFCQEGHASDGATERGQRVSGVLTHPATGRA